MPQRMPLAPCDGNRGINKELRPTERAQINMARVLGLTHEQIGALTFLKPATVSSTLRRNPQRTDFQSLLRPDRPPVLTR